MKIFNLSFEKSYGAVIFRREDVKIKYLILHYRWGHWEFPRGHQEAGETQQETALREINEETGLTDIRIIPGFLESHWFFYKAKGAELEKRIEKGRGTNIFKTAYLYLAETKTSEVNILATNEQIGYVWLEYDEALKKVTFKEAKNILQKAHDFLEKLS